MKTPEHRRALPLCALLVAQRHQMTPEGAKVYSDLQCLYDVDLANPNRQTDNTISTIQVSTYRAFRPCRSFSVQAPILSTEKNITQTDCHSVHSMCLVWYTWPRFTAINWHFLFTTFPFDVEGKKSNFCRILRFCLVCQSWVVIWSLLLFDTFPEYGATERIRFKSFTLF